MFTKSDIDSLRANGTTDRQIMEMTARVIPSASKALRDIDADKTTPDIKKSDILKQMIDRNAKSTGTSMLPYVSALTLNAATKKSDVMQTSYKAQEDAGFSLMGTAGKIVKKTAGAFASVPEALMYPVVQGARAANYLAGVAAEPFTGEAPTPLVSPEQVERTRKASWQAAPMASTMMLGAGGLAAGVPLTSLSTSAALTSGGLAGVGTLETGGSVSNAAMNALLSGVSTKAFLTLGPSGSAATAVGMTGVGRYMAGEDINSGQAAEDYISSGILGYVGGKAIQKEKQMLTRGKNTSKVFQPEKLSSTPAPTVADRLQTTAQSIYQSALKPSKAVLDRYPDVVKTGLEERIPVSKAGGERVLDTIDMINKDIGATIETSKAAGNVIIPSNVIKALSDTVKFYKEVIGGKKSVMELEQLANEFMKDEGFAIPVDRAQKLKVNTYNVLRRAYGEMKTAEIEGKKALARGLKDELVSVIPELKGLNARESKLIGLDTALERFTGRYGNRDLVDLTSGIGGAIGMTADGLTGGLKGFALTKLAKLALDHPTIKSHVAILLNELGKKMQPIKVLSPEEVPANMEIINLQGASQGSKPSPQGISKTSPPTLPPQSQGVNTVTPAQRAMADSADNLSQVSAGQKAEASRALVDPTIDGGVTQAKAQKLADLSEKALAKKFPTLTPEEIANLTPEEKATGLIGGSDSVKTVTAEDLVKSARKDSGIAKAIKDGGKEYQIIDVPMDKISYDYSGQYFENPKASAETIAKYTKTKGSPVILNAKGEVIDGNHRALAALSNGETSIQAYVPKGTNISSFDNLNTRLQAQGSSYENYFGKSKYATPSPLPSVGGGKVIPKELEPLAKEAMKFKKQGKTASDFAESFKVGNKNHSDTKGNVQALLGEDGVKVWQEQFYKSGVDKPANALEDIYNLANKSSPVGGGLEPLMKEARKDLARYKELENTLMSTRDNSVREQVRAEAGQLAKKYGGDRFNNYGHIQYALLKSLGLDGRKATLAQLAMESDSPKAFLKTVEKLKLSPDLKNVLDITNSKSQLTDLWNKANQ